MLNIIVLGHFFFISFVLFGKQTYTKKKQKKKQQKTTDKINKQTHE